jgi:hypothetical protein
MKQMKFLNNRRVLAGTGRRIRNWLWLGGLLLAPVMGQTAERPEQVRAQMHNFSLTFKDYRQEDRATFEDSDPMSIEFESEFQLFGRLSENPIENTFMYTVFNDSLLYRSVQPLRFITFMSGDTIHYTSQEGPDFINRSYSEAHDSMLACLFGGPALTIGKSSTGPGIELTPVNQDCRSGEYKRLDPAGAIGLFFTGAQPADLKKGYRWQEYKFWPGYSGLGFRPLLRLSGRIVMIEGCQATAVLSVDTTCSNVQSKLPNGENTTILSESIQIGGTLVLDTKTGCPLRGEVRIEETVSYFRPRVSEQVLEKEGSYILRWRRY